MLAVLNQAEVLLRAPPNLQDDDIKEQLAALLQSTGPVCKLVEKEQKVPGAYQSSDDNQGHDSVDGMNWRASDVRKEKISTPKVHRGERGATGKKRMKRTGTDDHGRRIVFAHGDEDLRKHERRSPLAANDHTHEVYHLQAGIPALRAPLPSESDLTSSSFGLSRPNSIMRRQHQLVQAEIPDTMLDGSVEFAANKDPHVPEILLLGSNRAKIYDENDEGVTPRKSIIVLSGGDQLPPLVEPSANVKQTTDFEISNEFTSLEDDKFSDKFLKERPMQRIKGELNRLRQTNEDPDSGVPPKKLTGMVLIKRKMGALKIEGVISPTFNERRDEAHEAMPKVTDQDVDDLLWEWTNV